MDNTVVVSTPPHIKSGRTTRKIMLDVIIALAPAAICGIVYFLWDALILEVTCVAFAVLGEFVYSFIAYGGLNVRFADSRTCAAKKNIAALKKRAKAGEDVAAALEEERKKLKELYAELKKAAFAKSGAACVKFARQFDFTSVVTGLILAMIISSETNWYEAAIGAAFAVIIVKMVFGGTGKNIANPAAVGRVFIAISFAAVSTYTTANISSIMDSSIEAGSTYLKDYFLAGDVNAMSLSDLFLGTGVAGCIGETCKLALIVGYIYLVARKVIKWWQPLLYLVVTGLLSAALYTDFAYFLPSILSGGVMFGAIFMATDYVTSPKGVYGQIVYYVLLGVLTAVLRYLTEIEVVSFVILIMNLLVPLIDRYIMRRPFGYRREKKNREADK